MTKRAKTAELDVPTFPAEFLNHLGFVVNRVAEKLNDQVAQVTLPYGLTVAQYGLLILLQREGPQAQIELSERVGLDRTTVMRTVDVLEKRAFVRRDPDPTDRRKHSVVLTEAGAVLLAQTLPAVRRAERNVTALLSAHEQTQLMELLRRLLMTDRAGSTEMNSAKARAATSMRFLKSDRGSEDRSEM